MKEVFVTEESVLTQLTGFLILHGVMIKMSLFLENVQIKIGMVIIMKFL